MKIAAVGDIHFRDKKLADIAEAWYKTVTWSAHNGVDLIVQAGDVFNKPNVAGREADVGTIYAAFMAPFKALDNHPNCTPPMTILISGNHDEGGPREKDALTPFDNHRYFRVIHEPLTFEVEKGFSICAVPWVNRSQLVASMMDRGISPKEAGEKSKQGIKILLDKMATGVNEHKKNGNFVLFLGHLEVTGSKYSGGISQTDGSFEFSPDALAKVGADAYALGHIHLRQSLAGLPNENDGYLGTLCQLDFGEEANETGFRCIEIQDGKIIYDRFINNKTSPKYYTTPDLSMVTYIKGKDYVKLKGETKPDTMPEGVIFSKLAPKQAGQRRVDDDISADSPIDRLLKMWIEHAKCEVPLDDLVKTHQHLEGIAKLPVEPVGSLERIDRICLQNIASHESTDVDLSELNGLCAIEGPNGGGKTTLLESLLVALYGHCPSRPSLPTIVRDRDNVKDSLIEVDFQSSGKKYRARREFKKTSKTFSHKAYLIDLENNKPVAGPKVDDVKNVVTTMVGDLKLVLSGVFSAQEEMDNLVNLEPAPRKDLLSKLLGTEKFIVLAKVAEKEAKSDNAWIEAKKSVAEGIKIKLASEKDDRKKSNDLEAELATKKKWVLEVETNADNLSKELVSAKESNKELERLTNRLSELAKDKIHVEAAITVLQNEIEDLSKLDEKSLIEEAESIKALERKLVQLEGSLTSSLANVDKFSKESQTAFAEAREKEAERKLSHSKHCAKLIAEADAIRLSRETNLKELENRLSSIREEQATTKAKIHAATNQSKSLEGFPDVDACKACALASSGLEARDSLPDLSRKLERLQEREQNGIKVISEYKEQTKILVDKAAAKPDLKIWEPESIAIIGALSGKGEDLALKSKAAVPSKELTLQIDDVRGKIRHLPEVEEKLKKARDASIQRAKIEEKVNANLLKKEEITKAESEIRLPDVSPTRPIEDKINSIRSELARWRNEESDLLQRIGRQKEIIDEHGRNYAELTSILRDINDRNAKVASYNALATALGRDGIPQLIVDSTIPHFQDIMTDLLEAFDGRWSIRIESQKEKAKGEYREVVDILVHDGFSERDVRTYSGGEKQALKTIIRIAFATLQAERSGKGLKILVLDEATDKMETSLSEPFISMLSKISKVFNQVIVVSHVGHVLTAIPSKVSLSLDGGITRAIVTT